MGKDQIIILAAFSFLLLVVVCVVVMVVVVVRQLRYGKRFAGLLEAVGSLYESPGLADAINDGTIRRSVSCEGCWVEVAYTRYQPKIQSVLTLSVVLQSDLAFQVTRRHLGDRALEGFGLQSRIETGDANFDGRFHIVSESLDVAREFFGEANHRAEVAILFLEGCRQLNQTGGILTARWAPFEVDANTSLQGIQKCLPAMAALAAPEQARVATSSAWKTPGIDKQAFDRCALIVFACACGAMLLFLFGSFAPKPVHMGDLFLGSLKVSLPMVFAVFAISLLALRGKTWLGHGLSVTTGMAIFHFPLAIFLSAVPLNSLLDSSQATSHRALVLDKRVECSRDRTYHLGLKAWQPGPSLDDLQVRPEVFNQVVPGKTWMVVRTKPGVLGFEWVVSCQPKSFPDL